jgi:hypothetical protein
MNEKNKKESENATKLPVPYLVCKYDALTVPTSVRDPDSRQIPAFC